MSPVVAAFVALVAVAVLGCLVRPAYCGPKTNWCCRGSRPIELVAAAAVQVALLAPVLLAALPTAQNVYVYAVQYRASRRLARSAVLLSTLLSIPVMIALSGLLG